MQKETVVANVRAELTLSEEMRQFLASYSNLEDGGWFARNGGDIFLAEFGGEWNENFIEVTQSVIDAHFSDLGLSTDRIPKVRLTDSRRGSWIMEAALTMFGTVGTTYSVLKGIAELPKLADGLEETKDRLRTELMARFRKKVPERIEPVIQNVAFPVVLPPPARSNPVQVACTIDARPMRGLTPDIAKALTVHVSVALSRSSITVENLGDAPLENVRIGLFKSTSPKHSWNYADAFSKMLHRLSGKQSISISVEQFSSDATGDHLELLDAGPLYVDCWIQDNFGIYLFNFVLE